MDSTIRQVKLALRKLIRAPLFTAAAAGTLALGIGANTAIFSVVNGVLLAPLPFENADELVSIWHSAPGLGFPSVNMSAAQYLVYRDQARFFDKIGMWDNSGATVTGSGEPERVRTMAVTHEVLPLLGVQPHLGRTFDEEDTSPTSPLTVVLDFGYWSRVFAGEGTALGKTLSVDGEQHEIIGVLPRDFELPRGSAELYLPIRLERSEVFLGNFSYQSVARLTPGATLNQASAEIERLLFNPAEEFPGGFTAEQLREARFAAALQPLKNDYVGNIGPVLWVLFGTVGIVLLIACANVANLFLARAEGRHREIVLRKALGASRVKIAGEFLIESVLLGLLGGAVGLALAFGGLKVLLALGPADLPRIDQITVDPVVLGFALGISLLAGLSFGVFPVLKFRKLNLSAALKGGAGGAGHGKARHRARNVLVVGQVALALVLLVGSGLMVRSFQALRTVQPGFQRPEQVQTFRLRVPGAEMNMNETSDAYRRILDGIASLPGVVSAGAATAVTMDGWGGDNDAVRFEDFAVPEGSIPPIRRMKWISPGYHETMGNPLIAGRSLEWRDITERSQNVVITEDLASEYWERPADAIGTRIGLGTEDLGELAWYEIVGVSGSVHDDGLDQPLVPMIFFPYVGAAYENNERRRYVRRAMAFVVRVVGSTPSQLLPQIRQVVWAVNPNLPLATVRTLEQISDDSLARTAFTLAMLAIASVVALLLGTVGIYGVVSYVVSQRTREIGVRMALGADPRDLSLMVVRQGMRVAGTGLMVGLLAAFGLTRLMSSLLFGVQAADPATYGAVAAALSLVALVASYVPAARAARMHPMEALRAG